MTQQPQGTSGDDDETDIPLIIFDECHKAKHLIPKEGDASLTAVAVELLQLHVPNAAVLYSSATGISEPRNMVCFWVQSACMLQMLHVCPRFCYGLPSTASTVCAVYLWASTVELVCRHT